MISEIVKFKNQQLVVNTYHEDELIKRDGFWFEKVLEDQGELKFFKEELLLLSLNMNGKEVRKEPVFKNFYTLNENNNRIEIYFP
jgi:hypothetical protein